MKEVIFKTLLHMPCLALINLKKENMGEMGELSFGSLHEVIKSRRFVLP